MSSKIDPIIRNYDLREQLYKQNRFCIIQTNTGNILDPDTRETVNHVHRILAKDNFTSSATSSSMPKFTSTSTQSNKF